MSLTRNTCVAILNLTPNVLCCRSHGVRSDKHAYSADKLFGQEHTECLLKLAINGNSSIDFLCINSGYNRI